MVASVELKGNAGIKANFSTRFITLGADRP
jgi:hypothetical protein